MFLPTPPTDGRELRPRFRFGDVKVDVPLRRVSRGGTDLHLEPRAFDLLLLLAANPERVVGKDEIFERLWEQRYVSDNALTRVVAHLRHELGDRADRPSVIETVPRCGYRFLPEIEAIAGDSWPEVERRRDAAGASASRAKRLLLGLSAGLTLAILVVVTGLWLREQRGGQTRPVPVQLTTEAGNQLQPSFSPDGSHIVYAADGAGGLELFVRPAAGGAAHQLTSDGPNIDPAWSPDGRWIAYRNLAAEGLWLTSPSGQDRRQLTTFGSQPAWSGDGQTIVFSHPGKSTFGATEWPATYGSALWLVEADGSGLQQLTKPEPEGPGHGMPAFSADGRWVVFATRSHDSTGGLWRVAAGGGEPQPLELRGEASPIVGAAERPVARVAWSSPQPLPDGKGLYVLRTGADTRILHLSWDGSRVQDILSPAPVGASHLSVSKDGRRLAFSVVQSATSIEETALDGEDRVGGPMRSLVASTAVRVSSPSFSPDGERVVFLRFRSGSLPEDVVIDRNGREVLVLDPTRIRGWESPTVLRLWTREESTAVDVVSGRRTSTSPTAREVEILSRIWPRRSEMRWDLRAATYTEARGRGRELMVWPLDQDRPRQLTRLGGWIDYPAWSRDGKWIVFQYQRVPGAANELWRISADGGEPERFLTGDGPSWGGSLSPRNDEVVYAALRRGSWHLAVAGLEHEERLLAVEPEVTGHLRWPDWSPDGGRIIYERGTYRGNVWTVEVE